MAFHTEKKLKRRELKNALVSNLSAEEEEDMRFELAVRLYFQNKDRLPDLLNNSHKWKPELARDMAEATQTQILRLERIIRLYLNGEPIRHINVMGDPPEAR